MRRLPLLLALPALAALAACGGGGDKGSAASSSPCASDAVVVHMADIEFKPETANAKTGQTVCWVNDDDVQHDVDADSGEFQSALFGKDKTFTWKATKAGTVKYVCTVHPGMTGTLSVSG